ncbi:error-prone DNA polymerase [Paracoccus sp. S1E-3]|uniref:error-prone DNA polymerase n=1 Tax=Paracoccus sp. S1E-3 TaxID=2756130 RepID=UPI0015EE4D78|nr:error-prone DNA polymerase [Paracoccus sp. S1E-3]MBA4492657.1 error-prone DNA polymerase [Paracoccus sp. S1E-3]
MPEHERPQRPLLSGDFTPNPPAGFVELGITTPFSFLRGASTADELVLTAHALGHDAIGVADLNSLAGVVRLHVAAVKAQMRPLIGARIVLADGTAFLAYPTGRTAYGRLSTLIAKGRRHDLDGKWQAKGACDLSLDDLAAHAEGLQLIWIPPERCSRADLATLPGLAARLPGLRHVAASYLYRGDDVARINRLDRAARAAGLAILATNDVHYHAPDRRPLQDVMTCIREGVTIDRAGRRLNPNAERYLKSPAEMARLFARWPDALAQTRIVAEACAFRLTDLAYEYPNETVPAGESPESHLAALTWAGAAERYPTGIPDKVRAQLQHELTLIAKKRIAQYFLTVHDIVHFARGEGILCQGRGSAANSAVCFVLGITPVDPATSELLFERFISESRDEPPDIDVDFEHERREEVIQHIYEKYGRDRAGLCATVIHYRPRSAIREVGKAMGLSEDVTAALANTVWGSWGEALEHAGQAGLPKGDKRLAMTIRLAEQMIGMPRHLSQHVGGFILTEGPLTETVPIGNGAMPERSFIEWDKDDIDALGILKVDVLALGMLTCIRKSFDMISAHYGKDLTLASVPADDPAVYEMLCEGDSVGVFQVESRAQMNMLPRLRPQCFYDLVIEVAIVRPGPIQGDMVHPYLRRRNGKEVEDYPSPGPGHDPDELRTILSRTRGVPIFQEQAMKIAMVAAEFSDGEANELRKAMATFRSRGTIGELEEKMVGRMVGRGYDPEFARRCFDQIKGFGDYGFPESHAAAFAHLVYVSAWLKLHYPGVFAAALLNSQPMGFYAPAQIVRDAREHGVTVLPADVNFSDWDNRLEPCVMGDSSPQRGRSAAGNGALPYPPDLPAPAEDSAPPHPFALRLGLRQIDGFRIEDAARLIASRDAPYTDPEDLQRRAPLTAPAIRRLAEGDAFGSCGLDRRAALWDARALKDAPPLPLFAVDEGADPPVTLPAMPACEQVVADYQTLRLSLKAHPMRFLRASLRAQGYVSVRDLGRLRNGASVKLAGLVLIRQRPGSAKGVCFVTIEDETGSANLVLWPKVFEAFRKPAMTARVLALEGGIQRAEGVTHVVVHSLTDRSDVLARLAGLTGPAPPTGATGRSHPRNLRVLPNSRDFH